MMNNIYNTKVKLIRDIFDTIMSDGYFESKEDAISVYTKDKFKYQIFVKKLDINRDFPDFNGNIFIDSVAITHDDYHFDGCCDADVRVAIQDRNIGKRIVCWINELNYKVLQSLHDYILETFEPDLDIKYYNKLISERNSNSNGGPNINVSKDALDYILKQFKREIIDNK